MTSRERHARSLMALASVGRMEAVLAFPLRAGTFAPLRREAGRGPRRRRST